MLIVRFILNISPVSAITGQRLKTNCDTSNLRDNHCDTFTPDKPFHLPLSQFADELIRWSERHRFFLQYYETQVAPQTYVDTHAWPMLVVYYETLQANVCDTLLKVATFVHPRHYLTHEEEESLCRGQVSSIWTKRTNDDLSLVLSNYPELRHTLTRAVERDTAAKQHAATDLLDVSHVSQTQSNRCLLVKEMLEEKAFRVFPVDMVSLTAVYNCATYLLHETAPAISVKTFQIRGREKAEEEAEEEEAEERRSGVF